jgi:hypothetical protein
MIPVPSREPQRRVNTLYRFYEKVIKVKAGPDGHPLIVPRYPVRTPCRPVWVQSSQLGIAQGGDALLRGEPPNGPCQRFGLAPERDAAWWNRPRPGVPRGETGKGDQIPSFLRGVDSSLLCFRASLLHSQCDRRQPESNSLDIRDVVRLQFLPPLHRPGPDRTPRAP